MKPFNLEEALAGKPVVTRDGKSVKIAGYNTEANNLSMLAAWVEGILIGFCSDGTFTHNKIEHKYDLFMASEKKEGWINIYSKMTAVGIYDNEEDAKKGTQGIPGYITTVKIEWEE